VFAALEGQQRARFGKDETYLLDRPEIASFYRAMTIKGVADGSAMLTALTCGDDVVATLLGLVDRSRFVMVRISTHLTKRRFCSHGRLVIVETIRMLHERGFDTFDFSIGDYAYKRRLGADSGELFDLAALLSPLGMPCAAYFRAKSGMRRYPKG
jgi:CelD/BcsL family acetyltransferase involved in cellulose biosynthesis